MILRNGVKVLTFYTLEVLTVMPCVVGDSDATVLSLDLGADSGAVGVRAEKYAVEGGILYRTCCADDDHS